MSYKKEQSSMLTAFVVCASVVALVSYLLPFLRVQFLGTHSASGFELLADALDYPEFPSLCIIVSFFFAVIAAISSLCALSKHGALVGTIIGAGSGAIAAIVALTGNDIVGWSTDIEYAAVGFYLFEITSWVAVVMSVIALQAPHNDSSGVVAEPPRHDIPGKTSADKAICPKCKKKQDGDGAYCRFCGALMKEAAADSNPEPVYTPPAYTPPATPVPSDKATRRAICPHCGARQKEDVQKCKYCGTPMK